MRTAVVSLAARTAPFLLVAACTSSGPSGDHPGPTTLAASASPNLRPHPGLAHCAAPSAVPDWATRHAPHQLTALCSSVQLRIDALEGGVLRLRYAPVGSEMPGRLWAVVGGTAPADPVRAGTRAGALEVCNAQIRVTVSPDTCAIAVLDSRGHLLLEDATGGGFRAGQVDVAGTPTPTAEIERHTPPGERFYGFGEKTGPLDKRGRTLVFWNTDAYDPSAGGYPADQDPLYL